jgi:hypothetical protein
MFFAFVVALALDASTTTIGGSINVLSMPINADVGVKALKRYAAL